MWIIIIIKHDANAGIGQFKFLDSQTFALTLSLDYRWSVLP